MVAVRDFSGLTSSAWALAKAEASAATAPHSGRSQGDRDEACRTSATPLVHACPGDGRAHVRRYRPAGSNIDRQCQTRLLKLNPIRVKCSISSLSSRACLPSLPAASRGGRIFRPARIPKNYPLPFSFKIEPSDDKDAAVLEDTATILWSRN
jgi:hypothetical protein